MCHKPNEIEVHVNEKIRNARKYEAGIRKDGKRHIPDQVRDLPEQEELDWHANWLISCAIEHLDEQLAERLWLEATIPGAWELLEWYFSPIPGQQDWINSEIECAEWDALLRAEIEDSRLGLTPGVKEFVRNINR